MLGQGQHGIGGELVAGGEEGRDQPAPQHLGGPGEELGGVEGVGHGDALAPALAGVGDGPHDDALLDQLRAERRAERRHQGQLHHPQLDGLQPRHPTCSILAPDSTVPTVESGARTRGPGITSP